MSDHTPCPWKVEWSGDVPVGIVGTGPRGGEYTRDIVAGDETPYIHVDAADAQLIAAAPDLLGAAEAAETIYAEYIGQGPDPRSTAFERVTEAIGKIRRAKAKATEEGAA